MSIDLTNIVIPAFPETQTWKGKGVIILDGENILKLESNSVEYINFEIAEGESYQFVVDIHITKL